MGLIGFLENLTAFLSKTVIPFILAIAALAFFWNVARLFIFKGDNAAEHERARTYALWSLIGFVLILSFWGIVGLFTKNLFTGMDAAEVSDYIQLNPNGASNTSGNNGNNTTGDTQGNPNNIPLGVECSDVENSLHPDC